MKPNNKYGNSRRTRASSKKKVSTSRKSRFRNIEALGPEILRQYPEQFIIYSEDEGRVIGAGKTEEAAFEQAHASGVGGLWHVSYSEWSNELVRK